MLVPAHFRPAPALFRPAHFGLIPALFKHRHILGWHCRPNKCQCRPKKCRYQPKMCRCWPKMFWCRHILGWHQHFLGRRRHILCWHRHLLNALRTSKFHTNFRISVSVFRILYEIQKFSYSFFVFYTNFRNFRIRFSFIRKPQKNRIFRISYIVYTNTLHP